MKIAILGWGSLIWNPGQLAITHDGWHTDGPLLPIEFARISDEGDVPLLTLVLRADADYIPTHWARSAHKHLGRAIRNLAARENTDARHIGYLKGGDRPIADRSWFTAISKAEVGTGHTAATAATVLERIDWWRAQHGFDAVVWTDLASNFEDIWRGPLDRDDVVAYLQTRKEHAFAAEEYVRRAPRQTRTRIRRFLEDELGWLPTPTSYIASGDSTFEKEWAECRTTIGRLDTILVDLRKLGFSFITALLAAGAILSFLGIQTTTGVSVPPAPTRAAPFVTIVVLIVALFYLDCYYEVLLSGAVERALDLETLTNPPVRLTKYLGINAGHSHATWVTLALYLFLLFTACGLGVLGAITATSSSGPPTAPVTTVSFTWGPFAYGIIAFGFIVALLMYVYWLYLGIQTGVHTTKNGRPWPPGESPLDKIAVR